MAPPRDRVRCHVCDGPRHPRAHLADPSDYGLPWRRRDDARGTDPAPRERPRRPEWLRRAQAKELTTR